MLGRGDVAGIGSRGEAGVGRVASEAGVGTRPGIGDGVGAPGAARGGAGVASGSIGGVGLEGLSSASSKADRRSDESRSCNGRNAGSAEVETPTPCPPGVLLGRSTLAGFGGGKAGVTLGSSIGAADERSDGGFGDQVGRVAGVDSA